MKTLITLLFIATLSLTAFAQDQTLFSDQNTQEQTLLGQDVRIGGFGGPGVYYTDYMGEATALVGGQGAFLVNHTFYIGCAGYGFGRQVDAGMAMVDGELQRTRFEGGYAGGMLGAILYHNNLVHGSADVIIGGGAISRVVGAPNDSDWEDDDHDNAYSNDGFFTVQPMAHAEVNVVRWMRVDLGAGYRFVSGIEKFGLNNDDVSGPVAGIGFRFGKF